MRNIVLALIVAVCAAACGKSPQIPTDTVSAFDSIPVRKRAYWPTTGWQTADAKSAGLNAQGLDELTAFLFPPRGNEADRKGTRTDGFVLIKDGKLVYEKYTTPYAVEKPHLAWSATKSFVQALVGIAVKDGLLKVDDPAGKYFPELDKGGREQIKIDHLLRMSSGIDWEEGYEASPLKSAVVAMLYTRGRADMASFVATYPMKAPPGSRWYYSSGDSNVLMGILKRRIGEGYADMPWKRLFDPMGMKVTWERDASGTFVGSSYIYATPRDLAKFGFLYLNDGVWDGNRILPEGWVRYAATVAPAYPLSDLPDEDLEENGGAHWWLNAVKVPRKDNRPWPSAPRSVFAALGHWGQSIFVFPEEDIIAVRVADDRDGTFNKNEYLRLILKATGR